MKIKTLLSLLLPLSLASMQSFAAVITFDFLDLIENQSSDISGRLGNGTDYSGAPLATSYQYFSWDKGVTLTASAQREFLEPEQEENTVVPSFVFLQPGYAGLGTCDNANCVHASHLNYDDKVFLNFSDVVEIINIEFSIGRDDSDISEEDDDYRAYNTLLDAFGGPDGPMGDIVSEGKDWSGSLWGNQLSFFHPEGTGSFIKSITVRSADVPEPAMWKLMALGLLILGIGHYRSKRRKLHI